MIDTRFPGRLQAVLSTTFALLLTLSVGCSDDDANPSDAGTTDTGDAGDLAVDPGVDTVEDGGLDAVADGSDTTADESPDTGEDADAIDLTPDADPTEFIFSEAAPGDYTRVDRAGMPAIATALISSKDAYNAANPSDDQAGAFLTELGANLSALLVALEDDFDAAGFDSCADYEAGAADDGFLTDCLAQAAGFVIPDTLKIDLEAGAGFPNGRALEDPVIDALLAVALLDVAIGGSETVGTCGEFDCTPGTLVGLLNPSRNDVAFRAEFPYLAPPAYEFATDAAENYLRVDRAGMPAIATAVITSKDDYNAADPSNDAAGDFVDEIVGALEALHIALADDFADANFDTCAIVDVGGDVEEVNLDDCLAQVGDLVIPDTLKIDTGVGAGFPNGRSLEDPVIDITLAAIFLDIVLGTSESVGTCGIGNCTAATLVGANPTENDVDFGEDFPYLAPAHEATE